MPTGKAIPPTPDQIARFGHIAAAVAEAMLTKNISPGDFNEAAGLKRENTHIYQVRSGKYAPSPLMQNAIHRVLGIPMRDLQPRKSAAVARAEGLEPAKVLQVAYGPPIPKVQDVLGFNLDNAGNARLRLDLIAPVETVVPLLRMLLDMGLVIGKEHTTHE